jgi:tetratricopeptide (TPR) repeat protein
MAMEEGEPPRDLAIGASPVPAEELDPRALGHDLRENERRWGSEGDSEVIWEEEHEILIKLQRAGDIDPLMKRSRRAKKALKAKGSASDLAQAALSLWVLERYPEAEEVLRAAISRLPRNRYPWSLLLRHLSWERDPTEAIEFIRSSLGTVPWKAYAFIQLGTLCIDATSRAYKAEDWDACGKGLGEARTYMDQVARQPDYTEDMGRTVDRLMLLVETLETRVANARASGIERPPLEEAIHHGAAQMEQKMRDVAEASGVCLEGEPDDQLDLEELERAAFLDMPEDDQEESYTVLEVTPKEGIDRIRRRKTEE